MNRMLTTLVLGCVSIALSGGVVGCSAGVNVDPNHDHVSSSTTTTDNGGSASYKKTTVRDANGNIVEQKTEKRNNY